MQKNGKSTNLRFYHYLELNLFVWYNIVSMKAITTTIEMFNKVSSFLQGKKTYLLMTLAVAVLGLEITGVIDSETSMQLLTLLGVGSVMTIRAAIQNVISKKK